MAAGDPAAEAPAASAIDDLEVTRPANKVAPSAASPHALCAEFGGPADVLCAVAVGMDPRRHHVTLLWDPVSEWGPLLVSGGPCLRLPPWRLREVVTWEEVTALWEPGGAPAALGEASPPASPAVPTQKKSRGGVGRKNVTAALKAGARVAFTRFVEKEGGVEGALTELTHADCERVRQAVQAGPEEDEEPPRAPVMSKSTKKKKPLNVDALTDAALRQLLAEFLREKLRGDEAADGAGLPGGEAAKAGRKRKRLRKEGSTRDVAEATAEERAHAQARRAGKVAAAEAAVAEETAAARALEGIDAARAPVAHLLDTRLMPRSPEAVAALRHLFEVGLEARRNAIDRVNADKARSGFAFGAVVRRAEGEMSAAANLVPAEVWADSWKRRLLVAPEAASGDAPARSSPGRHADFSRMGKTPRAAQDAQPKVEDGARFTPGSPQVHPS
jgi:hypothetical protein